MQGTQPDMGLGIASSDLRVFVVRTVVGLTLPPTALAPHGLFPKRTNLSYRQDAKVAKANEIDGSACGETTSGTLGVLGVSAVRNRAHVEFQAKTMTRIPPGLRAASHLPVRLIYCIPQGQPGFLAVIMQFVPGWRKGWYA